MTLADALLERCESDWVYLAEVASIVRRNENAISEEQVKQRTLQLVHDLVKSGLITVGDLSDTDGRFVSWSLPLPETMNRVRGSWDALSRPINLGDVCWLSTTQEGEFAAKNIPVDALDL